MPLNGNGTIGSPYQIGLLNDLHVELPPILQAAGETIVYCEQTADIDFTGVSTWPLRNLGIASIHYDGKGYAWKNIHQEVSHLSDAGTGVFGVIRGLVKNLGVYGTFINVGTGQSGSGTISSGLYMTDQVPEYGFMDCDLDVNVTFSSGSCGMVAIVLGSSGGSIEIPPTLRGITIRGNYHFNSTPSTWGGLIGFVNELIVERCCVALTRSGAPNPSQNYGAVSGIVTRPITYVGAVTLHSSELAPKDNASGVDPIVGWGTTDWARTPSQLKEQSQYIDWDFTSTYRIHENETFPWNRNVGQTTSQIELNPQPGEYIEDEFLLVSASLDVPGRIYYDFDQAPTFESEFVSSGGEINIEIPSSLHILGESRYRKALALDSVDYTGAPPLPTPTFDPDSGTFEIGVLGVTVNVDSIEPLNIHYTTDGTDPTRESPYVGNGGVVEVAVGRDDVTLKVRAYSSVMSPSPVAVAIYAALPRAEKPSIDPPGGRFDEGLVTITVTSSTPTSVVHYTTDGFTPTQESPSLNDGDTIQIEIKPAQFKRVRFRSFATGFSPSLVLTAEFFPLNLDNIPIESTIVGGVAPAFQNRTSFVPGKVPSRFDDPTAGRDFAIPTGNKVVDQSGGLVSGRVVKVGRNVVCDTEVTTAPDAQENDGRFERGTGFEGINIQDS